jgi:hypothetical protein
VTLSKAPRTFVGFTNSGSSRGTDRDSAICGITNSVFSGPSARLQIDPSKMGRITRSVGTPAESWGRSSLLRCIHDTVKIAAMTVMNSLSLSKIVVT